jgi:cytochrome b561/polyisoprenoid-binding protein YceI
MVLKPGPGSKPPRRGRLIAVSPPHPDDVGADADLATTTALAHRSARYTPGALVLHWLIALAVLAMIPLGLIMKRAGLALETKLWLYQLHKSIGLTIFALMLARIAVRMRHAPPPLPAGISALFGRLAHSAHLALYMLLIALPITGWLLASSAVLNVQTLYFNLFTVPHLPGWATLPVETRRVFEVYYANLHGLTALALGVLVLIHIGAALYHLRHGIDLLARMMPWRPAGKTQKIRVASRLLPVMLAALVLAPAASAAGPSPEWTTDPAASSLTFAVQAGAETVRGRFPDFSARISFDPAAPETARVEISIAIAALTTGSAEIDGALKLADWFDAGRHPTAMFKADRAERTATGYTIHGALTVRGTTHPVALPFTLSITGRRAEATGEITLNRLHFGVGRKDPIAGFIIAPEVRVTLKLVAERQD